MVIINEIFEEYRNNPHRELISETLNFLYTLEDKFDETETGLKIAELINKLQKEL